MNTVISAIKQDLARHDDAAQCLALTCIANMSGTTIAPQVAPSVQRLLVSQDSHVCVKKKAALCLLRLFRTNPEVSVLKCYRRIVHLYLIFIENVQYFSVLCTKNGHLVFLLCSKLATWEYSLPLCLWCLDWQVDRLPTTKDYARKYISVFVFLLFSGLFASFFCKFAILFSFIYSPSVLIIFFDF